MIYDVNGVFFAGASNGSFAEVERTADGIATKAGGASLDRLPSDSFPMTMNEAMIRMPIVEQSAPRKRRKKAEQNDSDA